MVEAYRLRSKLNQTKIRTLWSTLMGPSINRYTKELHIRKDKLYITLESSPLKQELLLGKDKIRNVINDELGGEYIKEVIIY